MKAVHGGGGDQSPLLSLTTHPSPLHTQTTNHPTGLRTLNLRQNILKDAADLNDAEFRTSLVDLELRDNLLKEVCACVRLCVQGVDVWA